jgi:hypothetical protein
MTQTIAIEIKVGSDDPRYCVTSCDNKVSEKSCKCFYSFEGWEHKKEYGCYLFDSEPLEDFYDGEGIHIKRCPACLAATKEI